MKRYLAILMVAALLLAMLPVTSMAATQYANVVGGWLRLRSAPNFNAETLNSYYTGTQVKILSSSGGWYRVETPDGSKGYMYGQYLRLGTSSGSSSGSGSGGTGNAYVTSHNGYGVRLRTGPGTGYRVIRKYDVGTPVTVLERGNYWSKIQIRGTVGYMMSQFLNFGSSPTPGGDSVVCYATVHSSNGYGVRLRTGPSKSYSKIGVYSVGTVVAVLEKGPVWDRIRVGSRVGWMMNEFLYYYNTNEVTSVTLNNYQPAVGMVLGVQAISPSSATVSYEWLVDGVKAGTSSTYTVGTTDVGKAIQLKVQGTGNYNGAAYSAVTDKVISNTQISAVKLNTVAPVVGNVLSAAITPENATVLYAWKVGGYQVSNAASYTVKAEDAGKKIELIVTGTGNFSGSATVTTAEVAASSIIADVNIVNQTNPTAGAAPMVGDILAAATSPAQATASYQWMQGTTPILNANQSTYQVTEGDRDKTISVTVTGIGSYTGTKTSTATLPVVEKATKPVITSFTLADAYLKVPYSLQLSAQGGGAMSWGIASGTLPTGLSLNEKGELTGTPEAEGKFTFSVIAKNSAGSSDAMNFAIEVKTFKLDINGGTGTTTTATNLAADAQVPIQAALVAADGKVFSNWTVTKGNAVLADANSANTICTLNASDAEVTAEYREPVGTETQTPGVAETETPTPAVTETETPAPVVTETETPIPVVTETETPTPVVTETETPTPVVTETETPTPVVTETETPTPVVTETETPTAVVTETETPTPVVTETETPTPIVAETETPAPVVTETVPPVSNGGETENQSSDVNGTENQLSDDSGSNSENTDNTIQENNIPADAAPVNTYADENPEIFDEPLPSSDMGQEPLQVFSAEPVADSEPMADPEPMVELEPENPTDLQWGLDGCSASWNGASGQIYQVRLVNANGDTLEEGSTSECFYAFSQMVESGCALKVRTEGNSNWVKLFK